MSNENDRREITLAWGGSLGKVVSSWVVQRLQNEGDEEKQTMSVMVVKVLTLRYYNENESSPVFHDVDQLPEAVGNEVRHLMAKPLVIGSNVYQNGAVLYIECPT